jgi:hypothetical protein
MSEENVKRVFAVKHKDGSYEIPDDVYVDDSAAFSVIGNARKFSTYALAAEYVVDKCKGWNVRIVTVKVTKKTKPKYRLIEVPVYVLDTK